ncbi:MAG: hypothetical protein GY861_00130, partial [bacterium]|nr:hypothetical protein [bacterium]
MLGEVEGFGNLTNTSLYINPTDGKVSAGKRVLRDPSKPYDPTTNPYTAQMSNNPNDFRSLVDLNFALSAKIDKYDSKGAISSIAETFADTYETVTEKGARGAYTKVSDIRNLGKDGEEFEAALKQKLIADFRTNKIHTISSLVDWLKVGPDGEPIGFTRNPEEANEHTILLKANPSQPEGGTDIMDEDAPGAQKLLDHLMEQAGNAVMSELNRKVEVKQGYKPIVRTPSGGGKNKQEEIVDDFYQKEKAKIYFDKKLPSGESQKVIGRNQLFEFASLFGVPVSEEKLGGGEFVYMVGDIQLERDADNSELLQLIESQIEGTDMKTAYRKRGSAPSGELNQ